MIKIIKEGKKVKFTKVCPDCGCEFEYELEDLIEEMSMSGAILTCYPPLYPYDRFVKCPCCGNKILHDTIHRNCGGVYNKLPVDTVTYSIDGLYVGKYPSTITSKDDNK